MFIDTTDAALLSPLLVGMAILELKLVKLTFVFMF